MTKLFEPLRLGRVELKNRVVLAPLTRFRNDDNYIPLPFVKEYYAQRGSSSGTLLISEASLITPRAGGYPNVPQIYNDAQIAAWKEVTDAVHAKGSYIFMQLWALGRTGNPAQLKSQGDFDLVSSSAVPMSAESPVPRPLTETEIHEYIADYAQAARNAIAAGFDGVEIHGANGYLIDQFTKDTCNQRTDSWGGSIENRTRFALEVTRAVVDAVGADRTAIRLSPFNAFQGMKMEDPIPTFTYLAEKLSEFKLAYTHLVEPRVEGMDIVETPDSLNFFLKAYNKASPVIVAGGFTSDNARKAVDEQYNEYETLVAFGRKYISNPDLPFRIQENIELIDYDRNTFYAPKDPKGYVDYEFSEEFKAKAVSVAA